MSCAPAPSTAVAAVTVVVNATYTKIQAKDIIISQQRNEIEKTLLPDNFNLVGADDVQSLRWRLQPEAFINFIEDQRSLVRDLLDNLSLGDKQKVLREIGEFILHMIEGMCDVQGEHHSKNQAAASPAPAVMAVELVKMPPRIFVAEVEEIESDYPSLCREYIVNERGKAKIDQHDHETMFNIGWDDVQGCVADEGRSAHGFDLSGIGGGIPGETV
uniref:Uncharacterized protein n=1 Tax=Hyaloperonospora arabidopsidis (strain Emoy2) TaxID=559515 RepID=M4BJM5_HYAAE